MQKDNIVKISSTLQCQKIPEGIRIRLKNHFYPNWKQQKLILLNRKPLKKNWEKISNYSWLSPVSKLLSTKNPKESSMFAKPLVSCRNWEGFDNNKVEKSRIVAKKRRSFKKNRIVLKKNLLVNMYWENLISDEKKRIVNSFIVPKNLKEDPLGFFNHPFCCRLSKKWRGDPLETFKKFRKKYHKAGKKGEVS